MTPSSSLMEWKSFEHSTKDKRYLDVKYVATHGHSSVEQVHMDIQWYVDLRSAIYWYIILWVKEAPGHLWGGETETEEMEYRRTMLGGPLIRPMQETHSFLQNKYGIESLLTDQTFYNSSVLTYICNDHHYPSLTENPKEWDIIKYQLKFPSVGPDPRIIK